MPHLLPASGRYCPFRTLFFAVLLFPCFLSAQQITLDTSGALTHLEYKDVPQPKTGHFLKKLFQKRTYLRTVPALATNADFDAADKTYKENSRKVLIAKIDNAVQLLDPANQSDLYGFIDSFYSAGEAAALKADLSALKTYLDGDNSGAALLVTRLTKVKKPIDDYLFTRSANRFDYPAVANSKGLITRELWQRDPFNLFVINYYNTTVGDGGVAALSIDQMTRYINRFKVLRLVADSLYPVFTAMGTTGKYTMTTINAVRNWHTAFVASPGYTYLQDNKRKEWFFNWLWLRGGQVRLNPLDFTTDAFLKNNPQFDAEKAAYYNDFTLNKVKYLIHCDTCTNLSLFTELLKQVGAGKDVFSTADQLKKQSDANTAEMAKLLKTAKLLNRVQVPETGSFYTYSCTDDYTDGNNNGKFLTGTLSEGESKKIVVHNIPQGYKAALLETVKENPDVSAVAKATDSLGNLLGQVAAIAVQLNPYGAIISNFVAPPSVRPDVITGVAISQARTLHGQPPFIREVIREALEKKDLFDQALFDATVAEATDASLLNERFTDNDPDHRAFIEKFIDAYGKKVKALAENLDKQRSTDSLQLNFLLDLLQHSTLPVQKLKEQEDKTPLYSSTALSTTPNSKSTEEAITPYITKGDKDTTQLKTFSFERGKHYRIQLSAGLAYTADAITQSTAKSTNGKISISNTSQLYQLSAGVHVYFGKGLMLKDERFPGRFADRSSIYVGIGIPQPLDNFYIGYSYDFFPGLKTIAGMRLYRNNVYQIENDVIVSERIKYALSGPFFAIQLDPAGFIKALTNVFKKQ